MNNQFDDFDAETLEEFANGELFSRAVTRSAKKAANITKLKRKAEELVREAKKPKTVIKEEYIKDEPVNNEPADVAENALDMLLKLEPDTSDNDAQVKPENIEENADFEQVKKKS